MDINPNIWQKFCKLYISANLIGCVTLPVGIGIFASTYLDAIIKPIVSFKLRDFILSRWYISFSIALVDGLIVFLIYSGIMLAVCCFIIFIYWGLAVISQLQKLKPIATDDLERKARTLVTAISCYRQLELNLILYNGVTRKYLHVVMANSLTFVCTSSLTLYLGYHQQLDLQTLLSTSFLMVIAMLCLVLMYYKYGEFNHSSQKFIGKLRRNINLTQLSKEDRVLLMKYAKSLFPLRVYLGSFGYFKKPNSLQIITKVLAYSLKGRMILKKKCIEVGSPENIFPFVL